MHKHSNLKHLSGEFISLRNETSFLPSYTPIFITDVYGRIIKSKGVLRNYCVRRSLSGMTRAENYIKYIEISKHHDICVIETKNKSKCFIIVSKTRRGLFRCVLTNFSEEFCDSLSEYFDKLCLYRDYIFSLRNLEGITAGGKEIRETIITLCSGVSALKEFSSPAVGDNMTFTVNGEMYMEKLFTLIKDSSSDGISEINFEFPSSETFIGISKYGTKFLCALCSLILRESADGRVKASFERVQKRLILTLFTKSLPESPGSIYEKAIIGSQNAPFNYKITRKSGNITINVEFDVVIPKKMLIEDEIEMRRGIDILLSDKQLYDMIYTVVKK